MQQSTAPEKDDVPVWMISESARSCWPSRFSSMEFVTPISIAGDYAVPEKAGISNIEQGMMNVEVRRERGLLLVQISFDGGDACDKDGNELVVLFDDGIELVGRLN